MYYKGLLTLGAIISFTQASTIGIRGNSFETKNVVKDGDNTEAEPFIMGGVEVQGRQFPQMVSVHLFGFHFCDGTILNSDWVLTTTSCLFHSYDPHPYYALVGTNHLDNGGTSHPVIKVVVHESYNGSDSWKNDIALLKVIPPIEFSESVSPVKLPEKDEETPVGTTGSVVGWGALEYFGPIANDLHKADLEVYDQDKCQEAYNEYEKNIYPTNICVAAEEGGKGPTNGDSAAPFIVDGKVIGIQSWQRMVNSKGYPAVMTKISAYIDWINEHMVQ